MGTRLTSVPFEPSAVHAFLDAAGVPGAATGEFQPLTGGTQNLLFAFRRGDRRYVLRRPPLALRPGSNETIRRETRVLTALGRTEVPHPRLVAAADDESIMGSAFIVMEFVDGANPVVDLPAIYQQSREARRALGLAAVDAAAAIGAVDLDGIGLSDFGRPDGFLERQVARWQHQLDSYTSIPEYPSNALGGVDQIGVWLDQHCPASHDWQPGLMHGDYHLANVLCRRDDPGIVAVVDWELATVGDPLIDLGWLLAMWPEPEAGDPPILEPWEGFPTSDELIERYSDRSNRDVSAARWYEVLACYKLGIILEGTYARSCGGTADRTVGDRLHDQARRLIARAERRVADA